jgi:hypothetical protein
MGLEARPQTREVRHRSLHTRRLEVVMEEERVFLREVWQVEMEVAVVVLAVLLHHRVERGVWVLMAGRRQMRVVVVAAWEARVEMVGAGWEEMAGQVLIQFRVGVRSRQHSRLVGWECLVISPVAAAGLKPRWEQVGQAGEEKQQMTPLPQIAEQPIQEVEVVAVQAVWRLVMVVQASCWSAIPKHRSVGKSGF